MKNNAFMDLVKKYREEKGPVQLSDLDLEKVAGGVGGADEATCPVCGKTMKVNKGYGDPIWHCDKCDMYQIVSDAEFIEIVRYMEKFGYPVEYPVWWDQIASGKK